MSRATSGWQPYARQEHWPCLGLKFAREVPRQHGNSRALLEAKNWARSRIRQIYVFNLSGLLACSGQPLPESLGLAWTRSHSQFRFSAVPLKDMETRVEEIVGFGLSRQWEERLWPRNQKDLKALLFSFLLDVPKWSTLWPRPKPQACSQETRTLPCL